MARTWSNVPRSLAGRWPGPGTARLAGAIGLAMVGVTAVVAFATDRPGGSALLPHLGGDYGQFYAIGVLQNDRGIARLYDLILQDEILHRAVRSLPPEAHLPYVYPPFLAPAFRPLALLPYRESFAAWLAITAACYAGAVGLMLRACDAIPAGDRRTAWWLALSFQPFAVECWLGGQLSALGALAVAAALASERRGRPVAAGLAFSLLLYKPTLLVLVLPLAVVGRRWRLLGGFLAGASALAVLSAVVAGPARCVEFARLMAVYGRLGGSLMSGYRLHKYVDLTACLQLAGVAPALARPLAIALAVPPLAALAAAWHRSARAGTDDRRALVWAATLCWTPVLNVYSPVYDVVLVVPGLVLGADAIRRRSADGWPPGFRWLLALAYACAAASPWLARDLRIQPVTLGLAGMGTYLTWQAIRGPGPLAGAAPGRLTTSPSPPSARPGTGRTWC